MAGFEYKVVPAPLRGTKAKGVKGTPARFARTLEVVMNDMGRDGWEYQRTDTLPVEERQGLTGKTTTFQNMLVFRRPLAAEAKAEPVAALIEDQSDDTPRPADDVTPVDTAPQDQPNQADVETDDPAETEAPSEDRKELAEATGRTAPGTGSVAAE